MKNILYAKSNLLAALLFVLAMAFGTNAWAQTFSIEASHDNSTNVTTFTITRSGTNLPAQTINFRTVNRSAYAGEHYVARVGTRTFTANQTTDTVKVKEKVANNVDVIYRYQNSTTRTYRFEVLDVNGFELAHNDRNITYGDTYKYTGTYLNQSVTDLLYFSYGSITSGSGNNYLDVAYDPSSNSSHVMSNGYIKIDDGYDYDNHTLCNISTSSLYSNRSGLRNYLNTAGCKMYATVYFTMYEEDDGYQYIQILADNSTTYDGKDGDGKIDNGPDKSVYKACFILTKTENHCTDDHYQVFPHRYDCHNRTACGQTASHTEFEYADSYLYEQKYQSSSYNANNNGALVLNTTVNTVNVRFDANGGGDDTWYLKNLKARLALVDATNPTIITNVPNNPTASITVSAGPYIKGNTFYVSVPFKEIVTVPSSSTPTLSNNWGTLSYVSGSGSNVLTFKGTITNNIGSALRVTGLSGTVEDLAGNSFTWPSNTTKTFSSAVSSQTYTLAVTNTSFAGLANEYVVSNTAVEPHPTVYFYKGIVNNTNQVTLAETTNYTLAWTNNGHAGNGTVTATGAGNYTGSVSTTFPIRWSTYTVSFHENGSIGIPASGTMESQSFTYNTAQNLTANAFSREGFTFAGWNTEPDGSGTSYSDGQSVSGLSPEDGGTVDLYAQWAVIPWEGSGNYANNPYMILYASQLDSLAATVNAGTTYENKFFELGADITYAHTTDWDDANSTENNYTAIGASNSFLGSFDGKNYTVSGIRIYKPDDNHQGLFGYIYDATVQNVTISDAHITGSARLGGIAGYIFESTVQNCLVLNAAITGYGESGAVVGYKSSGTLSHNYYRNCIVNAGSNTYTTNIGLGAPQNDYVNEVASLHTLSLGEHITATGESVVIDNVTYYLHLSTITLGYQNLATGNNLTYTYNDGTVHTLSGNTFTMPAVDNVAVSATVADVWGVTNNPAADGSQEHPYIITDTTGLNLLAKMVNGTHGYTANDFYNKHFKLGNNITYSTTGLGENESNYTAIGNSSHQFQGTFDGDGYTVSGIRIYTTDNYQGLFGYVYNSNAIVKNVILANSIIVGNDNVAGIAGRIEYGTVANCRVGSNVTIGVGTRSNAYHGGIVGNFQQGTISGCVSASSVNGDMFCGGIAGRIYGGTIKDCLSTGTVTGSSSLGSIAGCDNGSTLSNNYYTTGDLGGVNGSDQDGARRARAVTLGENLALVGDPTVYDVSGLTAIGTGNHVLSHNNGNATTLYSGATQTVSFTYTGTVPEGYLLTVKYNDGNDHILSPTAGVYTFTMPAANVSVSATLVPDYATHWNADADHDGTTEERAYIITTTTGLNLLASEVNGGNDFNGKFFKLGNNITYSYNTDWNDATSTENNFTTIGTNVYDEGHGYYYRSFRGTFNGCGYTISGIRIYKGGTTNADNYQGLFGRVVGGTIMNLTLTDAVITGRENVGGIAGYISMNAGLGGIIDNCHVSDSVTLHAVADNASNHGGIVGLVNGGTVSGCTSAATLSYASGLTDCAVYGGIVGYIGGDMQNCLVLGANVSGTNYVGAVVGTKNDNHTYAANYYRGCTVNGTVDATNVGIGSEEFNTSPKDIDGVRSLHTLTLGDGISTTNASETKVIGDVTYYASASTVTISTTVPTGYAFDGFSATGGTLSGSTNPCTLTFTPAADVSVSATFVPDYATWWHADADHDGTTEERTYIITTTTGLNLLASEVNGGKSFYNTFFKLGADIEYSYEGLGENESNYTAIGTFVNIGGNGWYSGYFNGTFDGCGHTVSGIRIYKGDGTSGDDFQGLFGQTGTSATIKNVTLSNARITGRGTIGGIVGYLDGSTLQNCLVLGTNVSGTSAVGAVVGYKYNGTLSRNYYNVCTVNGNASGIGCSSPSGNATVDITENDGAVEGYALTLGEHITATSSSGFAYNVSGYCAVGATLTLSAEGYTLSGGYIVKDAQNNDVPLTNGNTFTMPASNVTVSATLNVIDYITGHDGTESDPYIIMYRSQLDLLAQRVNSGTGDFSAAVGYSGKFFKLGANIHYPYTTAWDDATSTENNYTAIGGYFNDINRSFRGTFDGDGHTISGIRIYKGGDTETADSYQGLFGMVYDGTIKNLTLSDARITGHSFVGGIVGVAEEKYVYASIIENCHVTHTVDIHAAIGSGSHGGIVGYNENSTVRGCTSAAVVDYADGLSTCISFGGIVGYNHQGTVENCLALGCVVKSSSRTGAIVGDNSGTLSHNYYYCTVNGATGSGIGCGLPAGDITENDGAVRLNNDGLSQIWSTGDGSSGSPYLITSCKELNALALVTNAGYNLSGKRFKLGNDISYPHTTAWDDAHSTENNYTAIGTSGKPFNGIFDGDGHTVSGIRIYKGGSADADKYQGLFGYSSICMILNLTLSDTRITGYNYVGGITGYNYVGGIAGYSNYSIKNCHVTANVALHAVANNAKNHGGIVGHNWGWVTSCTSAATLSVANGVNGCENYGGIVGYNDSSIQNCLVAGANISGNRYVGAIVGYHNNYPYNGLKFNYYYSCTVNGSANASYVGCGRSNSYYSPQDISYNSGAISAQVVSRSIEGYGNSTGSDHWAFIASPMSWLYEEYQTPHHVQQLMATPAENYDLYRFNQAAEGAEWQNYKAHAGSSNAQGDIDFLIENGQGYLYASKEDVTLTFLGIPYSSNSRTVTLSYTDGKPLAGYNLVGNPFTENATLNRSYYRMNDAGTGLVAEPVNGSTAIAPCTGVIVQTTAEEVAAEENKAIFTQVNTTRGESVASKGRLKIALTQVPEPVEGPARNQGGVSTSSTTASLDNAIVSFTEGSQLGKFYFGRQNANIYIPQDGKDYAIAVIASGSEAIQQVEVPINFKARENGEYTITVQPEGVEMAYLHLIDNLTGADVDLLGSSLTPSNAEHLRAKRGNPDSYSFTAKVTDYESRFKLVFATQVPEPVEGPDPTFAFCANGDWIILNPSTGSGASTLQVFDMLGRQLSSQEIHSAFRIPHSAFPVPGVYVLRLINGQNIKTQKIVIR